MIGEIKQENNLFAGSPNYVVKSSVVNQEDVPKAKAVEMYKKRMAIT